MFSEEKHEKFELTCIHFAKKSYKMLCRDQITDPQQEMK